MPVSVVSRVDGAGDASTDLIAGDHCPKEV
jgi:hypothetical protein